MNRIITITIAIALVAVSFVLGMKAGLAEQAEQQSVSEWTPPQIDPQQWGIFHKTPPPGQ